MMNVHGRPVVASLYSSVSSGKNSPQRPSSSHPLSSISLSSDGSHAVASGRDVLHVLRLSLDKDAGHEALQEVRSVRISQYFQAPAQTSGGAITRPQYAHVHDVLSASGQSVPTPTVGGGGGVNVTVTDVAWSLPQSYFVDYTENISPGDESNTTESIDDAIDSEQHPGHYPSYIKRVSIASNGKEQFYTANISEIGDSIVAAAGSNGVVVAWHHSALIGEATNALPNNVPSGLFHGRRERSASTSTTIGQPEAVFLAHSRAVNRLAWHPTGNRPYLLLTASQDGTVKLWDRRATSAAPIDEQANSSVNIPKMRTWFGFGGTQLTANKALSASTNLTTSNWHCISTYTPKCEAIRDIKWNPFLENVFSMVSDNGTLCVYDIRFNRPLIKTTSAHAGEATSVDWHPSEKYILATGGGRDRLVKVWDTESSLNIHKTDESAPIVSNSASYVSGCTDSSGENFTKIDDTDTGSRQVYNNDYICVCIGRNTPNQLTIGSTTGNLSPLKRNVLSGLALSRHHKQHLPIYTLFTSSPITHISWESNGPNSFLEESIIAISTSPISGANAGGNGTVALWTCNRPFLPISIVEGHVEGAVTDFIFINDASEDANVAFNRRSSVPSFPSSKTTPSTRMLSNAYDAVVSTQKERGHRSMILSVGRDGRCLLQDFSLGEKPILQVPKSTFALASLSPFQPGFGSLQLMSIHQNIAAKATRSALVFSVTDQGDADDLVNHCQQKCVDVAPELTHISRFSELYLTTSRNNLKSTREICQHNARVARSLNRNIVCSMWQTLSIILEGSDSGALKKTNKPLESALSFILLGTLQTLLLQRADAGDVQTCVVICEVMGVILPPEKTGDPAKSALPDVGIEIIREWYLSYIDLLQQMCLFTQAASLIKNCHDPVIGALNQQSTTINESCPICSKPLLGGESIVKDQSENSRRPTSQRVCRSCKGKIGLCFLCHEPVKGIFVWCPGCGHGGHLDHALEWFGTSDVCPTGCGHKCNIFPSSSKR